MLRKIINWWRKRKERKYMNRICRMFIEDAVRLGASDFLTRVEQEKSRLQKYRLKKEFKEYIEIFIYLKHYNDSPKFNFKDWYYGFPALYTNSNEIILFTRKGKRQSLGIPDTFLSTEKDWHREDFNKRVDEILDD